MKLLKNQGSERASLTAGGSLDVASPDLSLFAYGELREALRRLSFCRLILPFAQTNAQSLLGSDLDRGYRNQLSAHQLARHFAAWLRQAVEVKAAPGPLPQATLVAKTAGVHVGDDGTALLPFTQAKTALDRLKRVCVGRDLPDAEACGRFDQASKRGEDMAHACQLLSAAVASVIGKKEERAVASLFEKGPQGGAPLRLQFLKPGTDANEVVRRSVALGSWGRTATRVYGWY
jgi:plasmid replication initiation protein